MNTNKADEVNEVNGSDLELGAAEIFLRSLEAHNARPKVPGDSIMYTLIRTNSRSHQVDRFAQGYVLQDLMVMLERFISHPKTGAGYIPNPGFHETSFISPVSDLYIVLWDAAKGDPKYTDVIKLIRRPCPDIINQAKELNYTRVFEIMEPVKTKAQDPNRGLFARACAALVSPITA